MSESLFDQYLDFQLGVCSDASKDPEALIERIKELDNDGLNTALFLTAGIGCGSEGGEIEEIVKKVVFQGKPFTEETRFHLKREMGDVLWYVACMCNALGYSFEDIVLENIEKLKSRYPGGFEVQRSENRQDSDL